MNKEKLIEFCRPFYAEKDIMHNLWHIDLVDKWAEKILDMSCYKINRELLICAVYFHGFVYSNENEIREWLVGQDLSEDNINKVIKISRESQRPEVPETTEGKILHDAHIIEGGRVYMLAKCLITGSVRGQTLPETIDYIEKYILDKSVCYLPETIPLLNEANLFAKEFISELKKGVF